VLVPLAVMASVLGLWRLAADLRLISAFAISEGPFSHWQAWAVIATAIAITASFLNRYGRGGRLFRR